MLKAAVDVYYTNEKAKACCLLFEDWKAEQPFHISAAIIRNVKTYEPGAFYKRELPCIFAVLQQVDLSLVDSIIVDGYVYLDNEGKKGLGAHLYEALKAKVPVIGVAKTRFHNNTKYVAEVRRGKSHNPLFVTAIGTDVNEAAWHIQAMAGPSRLPILLKYLDRRTREGEH